MKNIKDFSHLKFLPNCLSHLLGFLTLMNCIYKYVRVLRIMGTGVWTCIMHG